MSVDVHSSVAKKSDQGLGVFVGKLDRQAGGGRNCREQGEAGHQGFLDDFKRYAATHHEDVPIERELVLEKRMTDDLVDGIVPADVFAQEQQMSCFVEQGTGMESARASEGRLGVSKLVWEGIDGFGGNTQAGVDAWKSLSQGGDGGLAANAAA